MVGLARMSAVGNEPGIPDGWDVDSTTSANHLFITKKTGRGGCVSVDLKLRGFRYGWSRSGSIKSGRFSGRGWRRRLVDAAVAWLESVSQ